MKNATDAYKAQKNSPIVKMIHLYEIQYDKVGNQWLRYADWPVDVVFDGQTYSKFAVTHGSISENLEGKIGRVNLEIGNVDRNIQYYLENWNGLRDAQVNILQVFQDELTDPQVVDTMTFFVSSVSVKTATATFVLTPKYDAFTIQLPRRIFHRGYCSHLFKGDGCAYSGGESSCNKSLQRCVELGNVHRYGAFPAIPQKSVYKINVSKG